MREGISLRAYAQKDPLIEYKKEAFSAFSEMNYLVKTDVLEKIFKVQVKHEMLEEVEREIEAGDPHVEEQEVHMLEGLAPQQNRNMTLGRGTMPGEANRNQSNTPAQRAYEKVGRNDPCPCGSGKKFKKCHGSGG